MMPSPDGIETLNTIKNDPKYLNRDTPIVVLTANAIAGSLKEIADEKAARDTDTDYLREHRDDLIMEYSEICELLAKL